MIRTQVVGMGSPHGDDQAGWRVVEALGPAPAPGVTTRAIGDPTQLLDCLDGIDKLILIDACRSDRPAGTIIRATWPDPSLEERAGYNSHSFGIAAVLQLAATL